MSSQSERRRHLRLLVFATVAGLGLLIGSTRGVLSSTGLGLLFQPPAPPTVSITLSAGAPYKDPATVTITATATSPGGSSVTKVEFFEGDKLLGQDLKTPFSFTWNWISAGNYDVRARATNDLGESAWSAVSNFSVVAGPTISIATPSPLEGVPTGSTVMLTSMAVDKDGSVVSVAYQDGGAMIGTGIDAGALFNVPWPAPAAGAHTVTAIATDNDGNTTTSTAVTIFVGPAPVVNLTATSPDRPTGPPFAESDAVVVTVVVGAPPPAVPTPIATIGLWEGNELLRNLNTASPTYTFPAIGYSRQLEARVKDINGVETRTPLAIAVTPQNRQSEKIINGINVGQTKLFDERSLALMLQSMQSHLVNRDFFDQASIAGAISKLQGARMDSSSLAVSVNGNPIPGITTLTNAATTGTAETITQASVPAGSPTPSAATSTTITNAPTTTQETVTQPAITPAAPQLPTQNTAFNFQPAVDQAPQTLLAKQVAMNYEIANLRLLLEGAISDRMIVQPINIGSDTISSSATRARAIVGFRISLDSLGIYKKAVAQVEITVRTRCCERDGMPMPPSMQQAPSLVSLVPMESNFNVATISKDTKQFGLGVAIQPISFGLASGKSKEQLYLIQDQDILSFEGRRSSPREPTDDSDAVTFGWQFRPVLGQEVVRAGPRQVYASLALPSAVNSKFVGSVEVHTYWRRYDSKKKTVGEPIPDSDSYEYLRDLVVDSKLLRGEPLIPKVASVNYQDYGPGKVMVWVHGENFLPGTQVVVGDQRLNGADNGLYIQGEQDLFFVAPASLLALSEQPRILGQFGAPVPICQQLLQAGDQICAPGDAVATEANFGLKVIGVQVAPVDLQTSRLTILVSSRNNAPPKSDLRPVVIIGQTAYGIGGNVLESRRNGSMLELALNAPTQAVRDARRIVVKELFGGANYTDEVAVTNNPLVTMPDDFIATAVVVMKADDAQADLAITGSNFSPQVRVTIGDNDIPVQAAGPCPRAADGTPIYPCLRKVSSSLLLLHILGTSLKPMKQIIVQQGNAQPFILAVAPPPATVPKPKITAIDSISVNDENEVNVVGTDLTSVEKVIFRGVLLVFQTKDGLTGTLRVVKELSESPGSKTLDFISKDGSKVSGTIVVNARPGAR